MLVEATGRERIVGHLCLEPDGVATAEVAVAVARGYQGYGVGRRLLAAGVAWARHEGVARLTATMFVDNAPIQRLLRGLARPTVEHRSAAASASWSSTSQSTGSRPSRPGVSQPSAGSDQATSVFVGRTSR